MTIEEIEKLELEALNLNDRLLFQKLLAVAKAAKTTLPVLERVSDSSSKLVRETLEDLERE